MPKTKSQATTLAEVIDKWQTDRARLEGRELAEAERKYLAEVRRLTPTADPQPDSLDKLKADATRERDMLRRAAAVNHDRSVRQDTARDSLANLWDRAYRLADRLAAGQPPDQPSRPYTAESTLNALTRLIEWADRPATQSDGLSDNEYTILRALRDAHPRRVLMIDLAEQTTIERKTCGRILEKLAGRKLADYSPKSRSGATITQSGLNTLAGN